jgi:hypothetical protein
MTVLENLRPLFSTELTKKTNAQNWIISFLHEFYRMGWNYTSVVMDTEDEDARINNTSF